MSQYRAKGAQALSAAVDLSTAFVFSASTCRRDIMDLHHCTNCNTTNLLLLGHY